MVRCMRRRRLRRAFSLVEVVMVVIILGVISAIAVPRLSRAGKDATTHSLRATLATVRRAIDCYYAEHDRYPGYDPSTGAPSDSGFLKQLTMFTDEKGNPNATHTSQYLYGPYLRKPFPTNPLNDLSTVNVKATPAAADPADGSVGWIAVLSHGYFGISATDTKLDKIGIATVIAKKRFRGKQ